MHATRGNRWGEPVTDFISCLLQHARDRYYIAGDDDSWLDIPYWVCAYANNQHEYAPMPTGVVSGSMQLACARTA
jgi:hypothetical protein